MMEELSATCPKCGHEMWKQRRGQWSLRATILKMGGDEFIARCPCQGCDGEVLVPWLQIVDAPRPTPRRRFLVRLDRWSGTGEPTR